jgi:DNA-directed RNA polymerase subunit H (RpoH/RPB5)
MTDIIDKILLNVTKMLTERKVLLGKNINKNYENLLKQKNEERIFSIKSDISSDVYHIYIIYGKLTTIKKIQGLDTFLAASKGQNRIFIGDNISQKAFKQFLELKKSEVFFEYELLMNIIEHELQPKFELLTSEEKEKKFSEYDIDKKNMSKIFSTDAISRYYAAKPGDIFRIIRPSPFTAMGFHYRIVIETPVSHIFCN